LPSRRRVGQGDGGREEIDDAQGAADAGPGDGVLQVTRYALLLRGINVGRAHRIAMAELRELLLAEGHAEVRTLLQSGNVVLDADMPADDLARSVAETLERRFGFPVPTVVRTGEELLGVVTKNPLGAVATDPARSLVSFFAGEVPPGLDERLRAVDPGKDQYAVDGRELYLWCPDGQLQSPLAAALGKHRGGPVGTVRNWSTVLRLAELLQR
jgi:uncharacterized protein (DUF1697 family)